MKPDSRKDSVESEKDALVVTVKEPAIGGRANKRARELIARHFSVPVQSVVVTRGARSRVKMMTVYG